MTEWHLYKFIFLSIFDLKSILKVVSCVCVSRTAGPIVTQFSDNLVMFQAKCRQVIAQEKKTFFQRL